MFGRRDEKMPSIYIAKADREQLGFNGMNKLVATIKCRTSPIYRYRKSGTE